MSHKITSVSPMIPPRPVGSVLKRDSPVSQCRLELAAVFLPTFFDEYENAENFSADNQKMQILFKSYKARSSCEKKVCQYREIKFDDNFIKAGRDNLELEPVNFMGKSLEKVSDTAPIQAYNLG